MSETMPSITRNGVTKTLSMFKIVKGKRKDTEYLAPKVDFSSPETWAQEVLWCGLQNVANVLQTFYKRAAQDIWLNNINPDGTRNEAKFLKEMEDFTSAGMKLKEIWDKYEEVQATLGMRIKVATVADFTNPEWQTETRTLSEYGLVLKAMADDRSRKNKPEAEEEAEAAVAVA